MEDKIGVYICTGCGIGETVDTEKLAQIATDEYKASVCKTSSAFCLEDCQIIKDDIQKEGVNQVVVAACSHRVNTDIFSFDNAVAHRVNLREQVAWSHPANDEHTQEMAEDYVRMGIVKAQKTNEPNPDSESNEQTILVIGGGVSGLSAALSAARVGKNVVLVEKEARLGGFAAKLYKQFPKSSPFNLLQEPGIDARIDEVEQHAGIDVRTGAEIAKIDGSPGGYEVEIAQNGKTENVKAGAIVLATGWQPFDMAQFEQYGFGKHQNVINSVTLEEMAGQGKISRPSDGKEVSSVALLLCDTEQEEQQFAYTGNVASLVALKQALYIREQNPNASVYIFYEDMQTPGLSEYFYKSVQQDEGIFMTCGQITGVTETDGGNLSIEADNTTVGGKMQTTVDMLVLSTGMVPATLTANGDGEEQKNGNGNDSLLNLEYLQGKGLPTTTHGYANSNFLCFPYETRRTGIYSAGAVRQSMDMDGCERDGAAAALKAIQCTAKASEGQAVHPRVGDLSYPTFFLDRCTQCGRCTQECPFGALELTEGKNTPYVNPSRCRRCGICMGACPVQIISFHDYSVDMLSGMIKAVEVPEDEDEKLRVLVFACENDAFPAIDMAGINRRHFDARVRVIPVRCLGSVNNILIKDAISAGWDGVLLMGCKFGEDYQCHFIHGSELSHTRMENVKETLEQLALETERVQVKEVEISEYDKVPDIIGAFMEEIDAVGPNPFKGF